jgi:hypothetical protein
MLLDSDWPITSPVVVRDCHFINWLSYSYFHVDGPDFFFSLLPLLFTCWAGQMGSGEIILNDKGALLASGRCQTAIRSLCPPVRQSWFAHNGYLL